MFTELHGNALHVVYVEDTPILYDTNRVTTYSSHPLEAELLRRHETSEACCDDLVERYGTTRVRDSMNRLNRLAKTSVLMAALQGFRDHQNCPPSHLYLHVSDICNLKCEYCYARISTATGKSQGMSEKTARLAIDHFMKPLRPGDQGMIVFTGGEPLLAFNVIVASVQHALRRGLACGAGLKFRILTNGTVMNEDIHSFLVRHNISLQISLDGPPEVQDRIRKSRDGCGSSTKVTTTLLFLKERGFENYRVRATVCHTNADLAKITEFLSSKGFENFALGTVMSDRRSPSELSSEDLCGIAAYYDDLAASVIRKSNEGTLRELPDDFAIYVVRLQLGIKTRRYCGAGRTMMAVTPEGDVYPCPHCAGDLPFRRGSVCEKGRPVHGTYLQNFPVDEKPTCHKCWARNLCGGGCATQAIRRNGDERQPDELGCSVTQSRIAGAIAIYHHLTTKGKTNLIS